MVRMPDKLSIAAAVLAIREHNEKINEKRNNEEINNEIIKKTNDLKAMLLNPNRCDYEVRKQLKDLKITLKKLKEEY